jgi:hypothetical protein
MDSSRFVGVVASRYAKRTMANLRAIVVWSDPSGMRGKVIPLMRENVTLPALFVFVVGNLSLAMP